MTKGKQKSKTGEPRPPLVSMRWLYIILFLLIGLFWWSSRETTKETNWSEFNEKMLQQRDVLKVDIANNE